MERSGSLYTHQQTYEADTVKIYGRLNIGAAGAVSSVSGGGISGIVKETAAGLYTISLKHKYDRLLFVDAKIVAAAVSDALSVQVLKAPADLQADFKDGEVSIQLRDAAGAAVNAADGTAVLIELTARRTSVGPFDS